MLAERLWISEMMPILEQNKGEPRRILALKIYEN
jgi:hypothetical protein